MKKLTVVIPAYKVEAYLRDCLDSLMKEDHALFQVICINDGSPDQCLAIMREYEQRYPDMIQVIDIENGGVGNARNLGLQLTNTQYIWFYDSDDMIAEGAIAKMVNEIERQQADFVLFDYYIYQTGKELKYFSSLPTQYELNQKNYVFAMPNPWNKVYRTAFLKEIGFAFPPRIWNEDIACIPALSLHAKKIGYLKEALVYYRQRDNSITSKNTFNMRNLEIVDAMDHLTSLLKDSILQDELEYLVFYQLCYFASIRFLEADKEKELVQLIDHLNQCFPEWESNHYVRAKPFIFKFYVKCLKHHYFAIAKVLLKIRGH